MMTRGLARRAFVLVTRHLRGSDEGCGESGCTRLRAAGSDLMRARMTAAAVNVDVVKWTETRAHSGRDMDIGLGSRWMAHQMRANRQMTCSGSSTACAERPRCQSHCTWRSSMLTVFTLCSSTVLMTCIPPACPAKKTTMGGYGRVIGQCGLDTGLRSRWKAMVPPVQCASMLSMRKQRSGSPVP